MSKRMPLIFAGAFALMSTVALAQTSNMTPGSGAKMNNAPSGDAMSDKSAPAMKTPGMAAPMRKHHARMHHRKMKHMTKAMPEKSM